MTMRCLSITEEQIGFAELKKSNGRFQLLRSGSVDLPADVIKGSLFNTNLVQLEAVEEGLNELLNGIKTKAPWSIVLPDPTVKMEVVELKSVPSNASDLRKFLRARLTQGFPIDQARFDLRYQIMENPGNNSLTPILAVLLNRQVISEYEQLLKNRGITIERITPLSLAIYNARLKTSLSGSPSIDPFLFITITHQGFSMSAFEAKAPRLSRIKAMPPNGHARDYFLKELRSTLTYLIETGTTEEAIKTIFVYENFPNEDTWLENIQELSSLQVERITLDQCLPSQTESDLPMDHKIIPAVAGALLNSL